MAQFENGSCHAKSENEPWGCFRRLDSFHSKQNSFEYLPNY